MSLVGEKLPYNGLNVFIKSADQNHFGDKQVYSRICTEAAPGTSFQPPSQQKELANGGDFKKLKKEKKHSESGGHSLKDGIKAAKKIVEDALFGKSHHQHESQNDVDVHQLHNDVVSLKEENAQLRKDIEDLRRLVQSTLSTDPSKASLHKTVPSTNAVSGETKDDDFDLFGSDDEEESAEQQRVKEERLAAYAAKKAKKPGPIAKSSVILDIKPWDDETDLKEMEKLVRGIQLDGLVWGASKFLPIGYGIHKLQIVCTIEDEKVSVDADLVEHIQDEFGDYVQSVDIVAFNKI